MNGIFDGYEPEPIKKRIVPEGDYTVKVKNVTFQTMHKDGEPDTAYIRVECVINYEGFPEVSIFITKNKSFNSVLTAFYDTFGIQRGDFNFNNWMNKIGVVRIKHKQKGEFTNMDPQFILDENGYAHHQTGNAGGNVQNQPMPQQVNTVSNMFGGDEDQFGNIPF